MNHVPLDIQEEGLCPPGCPSSLVIQWHNRQGRYARGNGLSRLPKCKKFVWAEDGGANVMQMPAQPLYIDDEEQTNKPEMTSLAYVLYWDPTP